MAKRTGDEISRGIVRLQDRIDELKAFDIRTVREASTPGLLKLHTAILETIERCFGKDSPSYGRLKYAARLQPLTLGSYRPVGEYQHEVSENIERAIMLLEEGQRSLREDLADLQHEQKHVPASTLDVGPLSRRVFVVHGHDDGARETVARFLEKIGFEAVILHEQANQGRTVIEKVEAHGEVGFAVVLLTPDDEGCVKGGTPEPRARQNVLLELGYFIGRLGRAKVCALKRGDLEIPSDFAGVVWEKMDNGSGWKQSLGRELEAAGHAVDWNLVMRP
ncbi:TIR domain-containing protein [Burkholderia ubonensis]|uniref:TIR domain-containing protein n=1 Tax=Burkholderia ubonensis TaxID=101571 RepID=UPI0009B48410|nr:nucleotide-binding protein [Burkholderia ubonensis]